MKRCAFLSTDDLTGHVTDDHLSIEPFGRRGWEIEPLAWRRPTDWRRFDAVIIRTPWDYQHEPQAFLEVLEQIESSGTPLANPLSLVRWNLSKKYLEELAQSGVRTVPTAWQRGWNFEVVRESFERFDCEEIVIKPLIGASAGDTFRINRRAVEALEAQLETIFTNRDLMIQPFVNAVVLEGEFSLFYFAGRFSHAVIKTPKDRDFRVQEEHGGLILPVNPSEECLQVAERILELLDTEPLYARVDLVRDGNSGFLLMELELIEPALYLRTDALAPSRFAAAFDEWFAALTHKPSRNVDPLLA